MRLESLRVRYVGGAADMAWRDGYEPRRESGIGWGRELLRECMRLGNPLLKRLRGAEKELRGSGWKQGTI